MVDVYTSDRNGEIRGIGTITLALNSIVSVYNKAHTKLSSFLLEIIRGKVYFFQEIISIWESFAKRAINFSPDVVHLS